jgi:hypothetical protein
VQRLAVAQPEPRRAGVGLDLEQARLAAHLEHLQHDEDRNLGQLAAQHLRARRSGEDHRLVPSGLEGSSRATPAPRRT